jgi:hypothetical protein
MIFESMVESVLMYLRSRDLRMEGRGGGGESAREIFEIAARSGQRNTSIW